MQHISLLHCSTLPPAVSCGTADESKCLFRIPRQKQRASVATFPPVTLRTASSAGSPLPRLLLLSSPPRQQGDSLSGPTLSGALRPISLLPRPRPSHSSFIFWPQLPRPPRRRPRPHPSPPPSSGLVGRSLPAQFAQPTHFMSLNPFLAACLQVWGQVLIRLSLFLRLPLAALPLTSCSTALMAHRILNASLPFIHRPAAFFPLHLLF